MIIRGWKEFRRNFLKIIQNKNIKAIMFNFNCCEAALYFI